MDGTAHATAGADAVAVAVGQGLDRLRPLKTLGEAGVIRFGTRVLHMKYKDKEWWIDVRADGVLLVHGGDGTECVYAIFTIFTSAFTCTIFTGTMTCTILPIFYQ